MEVPFTQQVRTDFVEGDAFLHAVLGAGALLTWLQGLLQTELAHAPPVSASGPQLTASLLDAALGVIALQRSFERELALCATEGSVQQASLVRDGPLGASATAQYDSLLR